MEDGCGMNLSRRKSQISLTWPERDGVLQVYSVAVVVAAAAAAAVVVEEEAKVHHH